MKYLGGKHAQAKSITTILEHNRKGRVFLEPFCGACNITALMSGKRIASDLHGELIAMWQALQGGWIPPTIITEEQYYDIKHNSNDKALRAFVGFGCSFGARYFEGYARGAGDYARQASEQLLNKIATMSDVEFRHCSYLDYTPNNMLIYCDPPYSNTKEYTSLRGFDSALFWHTMIKWSQHNSVFVSEYSVPEDVAPYVTLVKNFKRRHGLRSSNGMAEIRNELLVQVHATPQNQPIVIEEQLSMF